MNVSLGPFRSQWVCAKGVQFYINDPPASISDAHGEVGFGETSVSWLFYADGLIMLAETK